MTSVETRTGPLDVIELILHDHEEARDVLKKAMSSKDPDERRQLGNKAIELLVRHSVAEEMYLYPYMSKHLDKKIIDMDLKQHHELEQTMAEMEKIKDPMSKDFDMHMKKISELFDAHAKSEEEEQLNKLKGEMTEEDKTHLLEKMKMAKTMAATHPHPSTNMQMPLFHKIMGPGIGLMDRLKDSLMDKDKM